MENTYERTQTMSIEIVIRVVGIVVTIISIIVTVISIVQTTKDKHQKKQPLPPKLGCSFDKNFNFCFKLY